MQGASETWKGPGGGSPTGRGFCKAVSARDPLSAESSQQATPSMCVSEGGCAHTLSP